MPQTTTLPWVNLPTGVYCNMQCEAEMGTSDQCFYSMHLLVVLVAGPPQLHVGVHLALLLGGDQLG